MGIATSVVSQLIVPAISTKAISSMKRKAIANEAELIADIFEDRVRGYFSSFSSRFMSDPVVFVAENDDDLLGFYEQSESANSAIKGQSAVRIVTAFVRFLVRYPDAVTGGIPYKDLVCDLFESVADIKPLLESLGFASESTSYVDLLVEEVTKMLSGGQEKDAADMIYGAIKQLCEDNTIMEVFNVVQ